MIKHLGSQIIETERLILRPFIEEDLIDFYTTLSSDKRVTYFLNWQENPSIDEAKMQLAFLSKEYKKPSTYEWAIVLKETGKVFGSINGFNFEESIKKIEVGYCIGFDYWGYGYTAEALEAIIDYFFSKVKLNRIIAIHSIENINSAKVMKKVGMEKEGRLKEAHLSNAGLTDVDLYSILSKDYFSKEKASLNK